MNYQLNYPLEFLLTGIQFTTLWVLFFLLYRPEQKSKRIMLICFMILWRPLHIAAISVFTLPSPSKIILEEVAFLILILLSDGKMRNKIITAVYLWSIGLFIDAIFFCLFTGISGTFAISNMYGLYLEMGITQVGMLLWAVFYYMLMRAIPQEAFNRVPVRFWIIAICTPFFGAGVIFVFAYFYNLLTPFEASFNFLFCGIFGIVVLTLNILIFYFYITLVSSYQGRLLAGELAKTPPLYTVRNGLSPAFAEKYDLSKRQVEVVEALLQGKSNKEIAIALSIEVNTVQVHLQNVYRKTGAPGRYAIMALVGKGDND